MFSVLLSSLRIRPGHRPKEYALAFLVHKHFPPVCLGEYLLGIDCPAFEVIPPDFVIVRQPVSAGKRGDYPAAVIAQVFYDRPNMPTLRLTISGELQPHCQLRRNERLV
jgi:hypothetical protein